MPIRDASAWRSNVDINLIVKRRRAVRRSAAGFAKCAHAQDGRIAVGDSDNGGSGDGDD